MTQLYAIAGLSKQAAQQARIRHTQRTVDTEELLRHIRRLRQDHPRLGLRKLYHLLHPKPVGRDRFIALASEAGLALPTVRSRRKTTQAVRKRRFANLVAGQTLDDINQVWVSDITYYSLGSDFYYITLLMDLYSRMILGACAAPSLHAHWSVALLQEALTMRAITAPAAGAAPTRLIHHSDRGTQYLSDAYLQLLDEAGVLVSTCSSVYDNAHSERLNGILKQEYLDCWVINTPADLHTALQKAVRLYNDQRPHHALALRTPSAFELYLAATPRSEHPPMTIWRDPTATA
jgi:putative transposase